MAAKVKPSAAPLFTSWEEVDTALAAIRSINATVDKAQAAANTARAKVDENLKNLTADSLATKTRLEKDIEEFCVAKLAELAPLRSRKLNHGTIAFTASTELAQVKGFTWAAILSLLLTPLQETINKLNEKLGKRYVRAKFELDKAAVAAAYKASQLDDAKLAALGMEMKPKDNFGYILADNDAQPLT